MKTIFFSSFFFFFFGESFQVKTNCEYLVASLGPIYNDIKGRQPVSQQKNKKGKTTTPEYRLRGAGDSVLGTANRPQYSHQS